jgi:hypothetical protein
MKCDKCGYSDNGTGDWAHACGPVAIQRQPVINSRIQALLEEVGTDVSGKWIGVDRAEKFAELIIENACRALNPMLRDMISRGQAVELIKQHFGVER